MKHKLLKTPQGAESIFLEEAFKHEKINEAINSIYTKWGYLPIKTPVFDYYETYENLLSAESKKNCFRLMDRDGELLLLRNDITLFLARQLGRVANRDEVLRVHYADTILRHQSEIDISSNEFFQTGAELVGSEGIFGDLEAVTLLYTIINELELKDTRIHIGSRSILDGIVNKFSSIKSKDLIGLINLRDEEEMIKFLTNHMTLELAKQISSLFMFIGNLEQFKLYISKNENLLKDLNLTVQFNYIKEIGENLKEIDIVHNFRFDLSEVANRDYYTGIVFKAYTKDVDSAIASGGRYDELISSFGDVIPSVGFSILLRKIESKIDAKRFNPPKKVTVDNSKSFSKLFLEAEKLRMSGQSVVIKGEKQ